MISLLLFAAAATDASEVCRQSSDCPGRIDTQNAVKAFHGEDTEFLVRHPDDPKIKSISGARVNAVTCRKTGDSTARCGFWANYKVTFHNAPCRRAGVNEVGCMGDLPKNRTVVYLANFRKNDKDWIIESAEYVAGLN